jgi:hypothetical protein
MQPDQLPYVASADKTIIVESQRVDRRSTTCRFANDHQAILSPREMIAPTLMAGIEQPDHLPCLRIGSLKSGPLELIAPIATEAEIVDRRVPARRQRNDMIEHYRNAHRLRALAITATKTVTLSNAVTKF